MAARKRKTHTVRIARKKTSPGTLYEATSARVVIEVDLVKVFATFREWHDKLSPERKEELARWLHQFIDEIPPGVYGGVQVNRKPASTRRARHDARRAAKGTR